MDIDPSVALDLADEEGITNIGISVHIGQSIDYARQIARLAEKTRQKVPYIYGRKTECHTSGESEAQDVTDLIRNEGIFASNDLYDTIQMIKKNN